MIVDGAAGEPGSEDVADDLAAFRDLPVVVSAGRREQRLDQSSVPVSLVSSTDIRYMGWTSVPEMLRFTPGMDVLRLNRYSYAVGVRGLHEAYADRTLTLINGRNAGSPAYGAADYMRLPVLPADIDRIEIVRGPGGAMWGANAFNGVVNILTTRPEDVRGLLAVTHLNEFGDTYQQMRWGGQSGDWAWKLGGAYEELESSENAIANDGFDSTDFQRGPTFDHEFSYKLNEAAKLRFGVAYSQRERGPDEFLQYAPTNDGRYEQTRLFTKLELTPAEDVSGYFQWYGNFDDYRHPSTLHVDTYEHDFETQWTFSLGGGHDFTLGANARISRVDQTVETDQDITLADSPYDETQFGAFISDRWQMTERFALEGQLRGDQYSGTGGDWSGRLALIGQVDRKGHHVVRVAAAKAFRAPMPVIRDFVVAHGELPSPPFPPGIPPIAALAPEDLQNEELVGFELGYTGDLGGGFTLRADGYYQWYDSLIGARTLSAEPLRYRLENMTDATAWGFETELTWTHDRVEASVWYALNEVDLDPDGSSTRSFLPTKHNVGARLRWEFVEDWRLAAAYRYTGGTNRDGDSPDVGASNAVDLALTYTFAGGRVDAQVGVSDLLDQTGEAVMPIGGTLQNETPGRTLFVSASVRF